jgi:predicted nucleic acid-binding protein
MILVDSSVWIDYFRGIASAETDRLDQLLGVEPLLIGDLILAEVLQGFGAEADFRKAKALLDSFATVALGGRAICCQAARNFRRLRAKGITVRKTIDTIIATCCIERGYSLLHNDRDFDAFTKHLGLRVATQRITRSS